MSFVYGLLVGVLGGGLLSYLYAQKVVNEYKALAAKAQAVKKAL
jgi:hypothetical protein